MKDYNISLWAMLVSLSKGVKRLEGSHQFKLQKFLECSHFLEDHMFYGPPSMHNSDTGERGLKSWAKFPASTAQKRDEHTFHRQVVSNLRERDILMEIDAVRESIYGDKPDTDIVMANPSAKGNNYFFVPGTEGPGHFAEICYSSKKIKVVEGLFEDVFLKWMNRQFGNYAPATESESPILGRKHGSWPAQNVQGQASLTRVMFPTLERLSNHSGKMEGESHWTQAFTVLLALRGWRG